MKDHNFHETLSFDDVLLVPSHSNITSRKEVFITTSLSSDHRKLQLDIPLVSANMDTVTEGEMAITMAKMGGVGIVHRFLEVEQQVKEVNKVKDKNLRVGAAIGVKNGEKERAEALVGAGVDFLTVDIAHGHSEYAINKVKELRELFPDLFIIAGNVATAKGFEDLSKAGADAIKVGIGAGSICTTRVVTGFGVPQLSAILDCAPIAKKMNVGLIADGGIKSSGDVVKAIAAGADVVMIGNMLAGTDEAPGDVMTVDGRSYKTYRGMASLQANMSRPDNHKQKGEIIAEGVAGLVPYKGSATDVLKTIIGGIRSGLSYAGARTFEELRKNAQFIKITPSGFRESNPHDIYLP